jgi:excisionase family DNA binding protein
MNKQNFNAEAIKNLERLNEKVTELIQVQRKANYGYDYITANELAELLGESIKTVYSRVNKKQIPFYKPGGKALLFNLKEIEEWIKTGRHSSIEELKENI